MSSVFDNINLYEVYRNDTINTKRGDKMGINYKLNVLEELKKAGYTTYRLQKDRIFGQQTIQKMRQGIVVYGTTLEKLCELLHCQPGDLLEYRNTTQSDDQDPTEQTSD